MPEIYPREPHSLREYYNDPNIWKDVFFPVLDDRLGPGAGPAGKRGDACGLGNAHPTCSTSV